MKRVIKAAESYQIAPATESTLNNGVLFIRDALDDIEAGIPNLDYSNQGLIEAVKAELSAALRALMATRHNYF
jgi:hypothetical protein